MNENDLNDDELEALENKSKVEDDKYDRLELIRRELNSSHIEKMFVIKRSTSLGPMCPYYLKAKRLFIAEQEKGLISRLKSILEEFNE